MQLQEEVRDLTGTAAVQPNPNLDGIGEDPLSTRTDVCEHCFMYSAVLTETFFIQLLRRFSSLMVRNTIADDKSEACPICFETLEVEKCSACVSSRLAHRAAYLTISHFSFECQHSICNNCLAEVSKGSGGIVKCPECRTESSSAEIKVVRMTEQDRWDKLLVIAQEWDAIDQRVIQDTSDDDKFIVDGTDRPVLSNFSLHCYKLTMFVALMMPMISKAIVTTQTRISIHISTVLFRTVKHHHRLFVQGLSPYLLWKRSGRY